MTLEQKTEHAIVRMLCQELESAGFVPVAVYDGGEYVPSKDSKEAISHETVIEAVFSVDESTIHFARKDDIKVWGCRGVFLVCGNGFDIISDWHCADASFNASVERASENVENISVVF